MTYLITSINQLRPRRCKNKLTLKDIILHTGSFLEIINNDNGRKTDYILLSTHYPCYQCRGFDKKCPTYR